LIRAFAARSEYHSVFSIGFFSNRWMVAAVAVSFVLVLAVVYVPFLTPFFDTVPLTGGDWLLMLPFFFASPIAMELLKVFFRRRGRAAPAAKPRAAGPVDILSLDRAEVARLVSTGENFMRKVLIPVHGTHNDRYAIQHVVKQFMNDTAMEVHLLNVQMPFSQDVAKFSSAKSRHDYHAEQAEKALAESRAGLEKFGIPYAVHTMVGDRAQSITDTSRRLHCDQIVMATSRKNSFTRMVEDSVTNRVLELTAVPVELIAGDDVSKLEKYGVPAALAAAVAFALAADE
jgi:nucleotide-binding universal stress UspA family protein